MKEVSTGKRVLISLGLVMIGVLLGVAGTVSFYTLTKTDNNTSSTDERTTSEPVTVIEGHYEIPQNLAEDTCVDEELIFSHISKDNYSFSGKHVSGISFKPLNKLDKNTNLIVRVEWYGYDKAIDEDVLFVCDVSSDKDRKTTIHYIGVNGETIIGSPDYKTYRDDGEEDFFTKHKN